MTDDGTEHAKLLSGGTPVCIDPTDQTGDERLDFAARDKKDPGGRVGRCGGNRQTLDSALQPVKAR